ncbi:MAG TPA: DUF3857 domain-containing protein [Prolixibacteraceae bacterium]|nr:DUF3857 domain-containing protein [Prolixibacteraceae bacterium]
MKKMKFITILVILFALTSYSFGAKEENFKFGKVSMEELNANICPSDSNAHAYYIFDKGEAFYNYINGFQVKYKRHFRIKIIDKSGFDHATFAIPYYDSPSIKEKIYSLKAFTYNVENGKIVKVELDKKNIFDEETTKNWKQKKFALPNVKEGSVIEVSYDITSDRYWSLNSIQFQYEIPVMVSDYSVEIPQYFTFNQAHRGSVMAKTTSKSGNQSLRTAEGQSLQFSTTVYNYHIENVPAFPIGEELTTIDNYISKAEFELASVQIPGAVYKDYTTTWADVNKIFLGDEDFGNRLKSTSFLNETANNIKQNIPTEHEQMRAALNFIQKKMKWNETNSCWCFTPLKKVFDSGVGSSADINMLLVALLREMGLYASPMVLSTRANGMIHPAVASINQMNYVIAACRIDGEVHLLDATDDYTDVDILPNRCLNDKGWIVDAKLPGWEPLLKGKKSKKTTMYTLSLSEDGTFNGKLTIGYQDLKALSMRNNILSAESLDKYIETLEEGNNGLKITDFKFENLDTTGVGLQADYTIEISNATENAGDLLFFSPIMYEGYTKNPFSLAVREYPVEYPAPFYELATIKVTIPEGYKIESIPANKNVSALNNNCQYSYKSEIQGNTISIASIIQVNQTMIPSTQYNELKQFFEEVVKKHLEKVVLKKI